MSEPRFDLSDFSQEIRDAFATVRTVLIRVIGSGVRLESDDLDAIHDAHDALEYLMEPAEREVISVKRPPYRHRRVTMFGMPEREGGA